MGYRMFGRSMGDASDFFLSEIRDLRRGLEGRDGELRGEMAGIRDAVATLSESVSRSLNNVEAIQTDVDTISQDVRKLRKDVDDIQHTSAVQSAKRTSAWDGPKKGATVLITIGATIAALAGIIKLFPLLGIALVAVP